MEKEIKEIEIKTEGFYVQNSSSYKNATKITDLIVWLNEALNKGATHLDLYAELEQDFDSSFCTDIEFNAIKYELESDKDFEKRKIDKDQQEVSRLNELEIKERSEYERLKNKYDTKS